MTTKIESLQTPPKVYGGINALSMIPQIISSGSKVALFSDKGISGNGLLQAPLQYLQAAGATTVVIDDLATEPDVYQAQAVIQRFRAAQADWIVAVGGGSVMDVAKLCSILDTDEYSIFDLLENPARGRKTVPTLMIPTTAGTGSEATPNAIVLVPERELKVGVVNPHMIADAVILDASLQLRLPKHIVAATGVDALAHAIECYTSNKATGFSDLYALGALRLIVANLWQAYDQPDDLAAKQNMLLGAFYAGVAIAAAGTTAVHALAYPLGGKYHIPHGVSNAMLLAAVMRFNAPACTQRLAQVCEAVCPQQGGSPEQKAQWVIDWIGETVQHLDIPTKLQAFKVPQTDIDELVHLGMQVTRLLNNNCRPLSPDDARRLYAELF